MAVFSGEPELSHSLKGGLNSSELHEAHPGESCMKAPARSYVWWPGLDQDIVKKVKDWEQC